MIIYASDFDLSGSGYMNLSVALCNQLVQRGYEVMALGIGYDRREHYHPFTIVPTSLQRIAPMVQTLSQARDDIEAIVVALDIPLQKALLQQFNAPNPHLPYVGIFPIEAGPLCQSWALSMLRMDARLVMSYVGVDALKARGVQSEFIPLALDFEAWRPPSIEEIAQFRQGMGFDDDTFVVLTVADNQERKNLSKSMEIFAKFAENRKAVYCLVTRPESQAGWEIQDLAMDYGVMDKVQIWGRGLPQSHLWSLYAVADAMLLTSKAEGLAMPVLEAMACRLPVIGTRCAAIEEHLRGDRGLLIDVEYTMIDPFGNSTRYMADAEDGVYKLQLWDVGMSAADRATMLDKAESYVKERGWDKAGQVLAGAIERAKATRPKAERLPEVGAMPELVAV